MFRALILVGTVPAIVGAHGLPIDVIVQDGKLSPFMVDGTPVFGAGVLESGRLLNTLNTDLPGIGVTNAANGVAIGTVLGLDVTTGLGYWNGESIEPTPGTLKITSPAATNSYAVHSESDLQTGMVWGEYDGKRFWELDGQYQLTSADERPGIYGAMVQLTSPSYASSNPFLLPFVFDPAEAFDDADIDRGRSALFDFFADPSDVNRDGDVSGADIDLLCRSIGSDADVFELTGDGFVDQQDVLAWLASAGSVSGDADLNGEVTLSDFLTLASNFGAAGNPDASWTRGDFDCDGLVAFSDVIELSENFGRIGSTDPQAVPEPASSFLALWASLIGVVVLRRCG